MARQRSLIHRLLQAARIFSQCLFLGLFLHLLLATRYSGKDYVGQVESFFHFDPLLALTTFLASWDLSRTFLWALIPVVLTLLFGRYVCGWICPLGAVLQFFSWLFKRMQWHKPKAAGARLLQLKYALLALILAASLGTLELAGYLDPLSLLYRSLVTAVLPAAVVAAHAATARLPGIGLAALGDGLQTVLQDLSLNQAFHQGLLIGLLFLAVVLLNLYRERFWCRYLCPAGALFGLLARWNLIKVRVNKDACTRCNRCTLHCQTQASPYPNNAWQPGECVYCYACASRCPEAAITFPVLASSKEARPIDVPRRTWIFSALLGLCLAPLFKISASGRRPSRLIRPPGALPEPQFLAACVKCGACMKVCPTNALQPASHQAGPEGVWTPVLVPRMGYCEYYCSLCTQVCPTGALKELKIREKTRVRIGSAWINKNRCLPYALGQPCTVCEEKCPTSPKAIMLLDTEMPMPDGSMEYVGMPAVDPDLCIGCGICETKCPVTDEPAIYCTSLGESRAGIDVAAMLPGK